MSAIPKTIEQEKAKRLHEYLFEDFKALQFDYEFTKGESLIKGKFEVKVSVGLESRETPESWVKFNVFSQGDIVGEIQGAFSIDENGKRNFRSHSVENSAVNHGGQVKPAREKTYIPLIVRETIVQLLIYQIVEIWHSSQQLNHGSMNMYKALLQDPRLVGTYEKNNEGKLEYKLQKR